MTGMLSPTPGDVAMPALPLVALKAAIIACALDMNAPWLSPFTTLRIGGEV